MATKNTTISYNELQTLVNKYNAEVSRRNVNSAKSVTDPGNIFSNVGYDMTETINKGRIELGTKPGKYKEPNGTTPERCRVNIAYAPDEFDGTDLSKTALTTSETKLCSGEVVWTDQYNLLVNDIDILATVCGCDNHDSISCSCDSYEYTCACYIYVNKCTTNAIKCPLFSCSCQSDNTTKVYSRTCSGDCANCTCNKVRYCTCEGVS